MVVQRREPITLDDRDLEAWCKVTMDMLKRREADREIAEERVQKAIRARDLVIKQIAVCKMTLEIGRTINEPGGDEG